MKRPKPEDFKVEYTKGIAEIASVRKQYSKAQDLYIDHLEQLLIHSVSNSFCELFVPREKESSYCAKCEQHKIDH